MGCLWALFVCLNLFCIIRGGGSGVWGLGDGFTAEEDSYSGQKINPESRSLICNAQCIAKCKDDTRIPRLCATLKIMPQQISSNTSTFNQTEQQTALYQNGTDDFQRCNSSCYQYFLNPSKDWIRDCGEDADQEDCVETCNHRNRKRAPRYRPQQPKIFIQQKESQPYTLFINWTRTRNSICSTVYLLQWKKETESLWEAQQSMYSENNTVQIEIDDVCAVYQIRVTTVKAYGYSSFAQTQSELPKPGKVADHSKLVPDVWFNWEDHYFYTQILWREPKGWKLRDIGRYDFKRQAGVFCKGRLMPPVPIVNTMFEEKTNRTGKRIKIHVTGFTCEYWMHVRAWSRCEPAVRGDHLQFTIDLKGCSDNLHNWTYCRTGPEYEKPGPVTNVTVNWEPASNNVSVDWRPPEFKGSTGILEKFVIQWGTVVYRLLDGRYRIQLPRLNEEGRQDYIEPDTTSFNFSILKFDTEYGIKILPIGIDQRPDIERIFNISSSDAVFSVPAEGPTTTDRQIVESPTQKRLQFAVYIAIPIIIAVCLALITVVVCRGRKNTTLRSDGLIALDQTISLQSVAKKYMIDNPFYEGRERFEADDWEIPHGWVVLSDTVLGRGAFGQVVQGKLCMSRAQIYHRLPSMSSDGSSTGSLCADDNSVDAVTVAVKTLLDTSEESQRRDFLKEISLMKTIGHHPNVVSMVGCCTMRDPLYLLVEHMLGGDLLHYLRRHRHMLTESIQTGDSSACSSTCQHLTLLDLLGFAKQIAVGMEFLSQKGFIHRDLATRNVLVGENNIVKIGDFGLTRYIYDDRVYVTQKGGKLPLKWMAIESIFDLTFSTQSDVWSFGVVIFEILTLGGTPYPTISNHDILKELQRGYRMEKPENCSSELYALMCECWQENPKDRPSFTNLRDRIDHMIEATSPVDYLQIDESRDYYRLDETTDSEETTMLCTALIDADDSVFVENDEKVSQDSSGNSSTLSTRPLQPPDSAASSRSLLKLSGSSSGVSSMGLSTHSIGQLLSQDRTSSLEDNLAEPKSVFSKSKTSSHHGST